MNPRDRAAIPHDRTSIPHDRTVPPRDGAAIRAAAVVVPARDEEDGIEACLTSVRRAMTRAGLSPVIVVVAHRCGDRTAERAARLLTGPGEHVLRDDDSPGVAAARRAGAALAVRALRASSPTVPADASWLLSTDADSVVPASWVQDLERHAGAGAAVAGLVRVHGWTGASPRAQEAYRAILRAGMRPDGHDHVYGANLAVRLDAYLDVGGWPERASGEDVALVAALRERGWPVVTARDVWVRTSGRRSPRAQGGLGTLLDRLSMDRLAAGTDLRGGPEPAGAGTG